MRAALRVSRLEDRSLPAAFGIPWANPEVSLSFVPDGTSISGSPSALFSALNQNQSQSVWQRDILRAYQAWVRVAGVDVSVVADGGAALGTPGLWQSDPRFGDIRLAAAPLDSAILALGTPADPGLAGTRAGDVILNSLKAFDGQPYDLFSVMLHEAGHSLGVGNLGDPDAVMFTQYAGLRTGLSAPDIAAIRALYGPRRPDVMEGPAGNGTTATASDLGGIPLDQSDTILAVYGDLTDSGDRDVYTFLSPGSGIGDDQTIAIKLQTSGFSLLTAKMRVYSLDSNGNEVERGNATLNPDSVTGGQVTLTFDADDDDGPTRFFIRIERAAGNAFDVGKYAIAISTLDDDDDFEDVDLRTVTAGPRPVLLNADAGGNNTIGAATALSPRNISAVVPNSRYEVTGSISASGDIDHYRLAAPAGSGSRALTVSVLTPAGQPAPALSVFDLAGNALPAQVLANSAGLRTIQVANLAPGAGYVVRVTSDTTGTYQLTADFTAITTPVQTLQHGAVPDSVDLVERTLRVSRSATVQLLLSVAAAPPGTWLRLTLQDRLGNTALMMDVPADDTRSSPAVLLRAGTYHLKIEAVRPPGFSGAIGYTLRGNGIDDPIGIQPQDSAKKSTRRGDSADGLDAETARRKLAELLTLLIG